MLGRSVTLNIAGQVGSLLVGFVASVALARWLGASDRGLLALMYSTAHLTLVVASCGLPIAIGYYASRRNQDGGALFGNSLAWAALLAVLLVPTFWFAREPISDAIARGQGGEAWVLAAALIPLTFLDFAINNQLVGRLRFGLFNLLAVASKVAYLVCVLVLLGIVDLGVTGGLLAYWSSEIVMILGAAAVIVPGLRPRISRPVFGSLFRYGFRVQIATIFQTLNYRLDVLILQFFVPLASVGRYVIAQIVAELVIVVAHAFQRSLLPLIARSEGELHQEKTTVAAVRHYCLLATGVLFANAVAGPLIILFAYGPEFHGALAPFFIILPGIWFVGAGVMVSGNLRGRGRPGLSSAIAGATVVVTVALDLALIPILGVNGAAIASLVAYTCYGLASLLVLSRVAGIPLRALLRPGRAELRAYSDAFRRALERVRPA
jgi:stage V sporulation protein B